MLAVRQVLRLRALRSAQDDEFVVGGGKQKRLGRFYILRAMGLRRYLRGLLNVCFPAFVALCLVVAKPQSHLFGGIGRFVVSFLAASLLLFVVRRSLELAKAATRLRAVAAFASMPALVRSWLNFAGDFNPAEPILPFRFQRPPPFLIA
jgi:hypothetical protein